MPACFVSRSTWTWQPGWSRSAIRVSVWRRSRSPHSTRPHPAMPQPEPAPRPAWKNLLVLVVVPVIALLLFSRRLHPDRCVSYDSSPLDLPHTTKDGSVQHKLVIVTDLDDHSLVPGKKPSWKSVIKRGTLTIQGQKASVEWDESAEISSQLAMGGRGMELSDLVVFDGKLLSVDDRTGMVYRITSDNKAIPWVFLNDGPGNTSKGLKAEWMTVKDCELIVGGLGKEWTTTEGVFVNHNPMFIKRVDRHGAVSHESWVSEFVKVRQSAGVVDPGYMIHESVQWSDVHKKWFFLPRRVSQNEIYTEATDEHKGSNVLVVASEDFTQFAVKQVGPKADGARGFSAFQFVPGSQDQLIVALKSEERDATPVGTYITVLHWQTGQVLMEEQLVGEAVKFEGIAFASGHY